MGGPLVAVRLHVLTRKTLGGLETDLDGRVLGADGSPLPGVYAVGEAAGLGGGGMHATALWRNLPRRLPFQRPHGRPGARERPWSPAAEPYLSGRPVSDRVVDESWSAAS